MAKKRALVYSRISVLTEESVSTARQVKAARRWADARGWIVIGEYADEGVSATSNRPEDREGWKALLAHLIGWSLATGTPGGHPGVPLAGTRNRRS